MLCSSKAAARAAEWPIGCFNRPWSKWPYDQALKEIKAAGYEWTGLLSRKPDEPLTGADATPEYLQGLKQRLAASGLKTNMAALRTRHDIPLQESIAEAQKQVDNSRFLDLEFLMSFGVGRPEQASHYFQVMHETAAYAQEKGIRLVMKPHGGSSGASEEILHTIKEVNHPNFSIWYDAGNIIYYTGKDPVEEIAPIAEHITGFCAKDCDKMRGEVMIQFGAGTVDFPSVFRRLKASGFNGPVMVECCKVGETPEETTANARANREFLERVLASI